MGSRCRWLFFSAWIILNTGGFGTSAHLSTRPFRCCVDKRMVSVRPKTPNSTKKPPTKRRRFTTSPHPGRDGRALPRPITRSGSLQALRLRERHPLRRPVIQERGGGKEIYEHYFALNPSPSHPILRLDRPTGPEPSSFAPHPPLGSPDRPGASQFAPLNSLCIVIGATRPP